jgi:uncharacterized protein (UPF0335 family)
MAQTHTANGADRFAGVINNQALQRHVDEIEDLIDERKGVNDRIKESYQRAKDAGFQTPILREIIRERKLEADVRADRYALLDAYRRALGMFAETPLGEAAMRRAAAEGDPLQTDPLKPTPTANGADHSSTDHSSADHTASAAAGPTVNKPKKTFAEQPVHREKRGRGRPRRDAVAAARLHLGDGVPEGDDLPPAA